jgi:hypothetical protein
LNYGSEVATPKYGKAGCDTQDTHFRCPSEL